MLAIAGGKGGSGKTTTALGLGRALARRGEDPVVVDCDPDMPDLHHRARTELAGGIDELATGAPVEAAATESTVVPGVRLLPGGNRNNVEGALRRLGAWHGPVLLDCPPGVGPDAVVPLRFADRALLVTTDRPQSVADVGMTCRCARELACPVVGALVRTTAGNDGTGLPGNLPELARVETVHEPLSHPKTSSVWAKLSRQIGSAATL